MAAVPVLTKQVLRAPLESVAAPLLTRRFVHSSLLSQDSSTVPRVASSSLWHSIIPKAFRRPNDPVSVAEREKAKANKSKEWNPATFFIAMAVLIGSNAIQSIALRNERLNFTRRTDAKLELLRETIERVRKGDDVDVEQALGTGDPNQEQEWEKVMQEIEQDDTLWQAKKRKREQRAKKQRDDPSPSHDSASDVSASQSADDASPKASTKSTPRAPGFF